MLSMALYLLSWFMLSLGGLIILIGGIGALRMPDLFTRAHASALTDSLGPLLILGGLVFQSGLSLATFKLLAILIFMLITGPTAAYAMANAAWVSGLRIAAKEYGED